MTTHPDAAHPSDMAARDRFPTRLVPLPATEPADQAVDDLLALYAEWRKHAAAAAAAYDRWAGASRSERGCRHAAYLAAFDQEAAAATDYEVIADELRSSVRRAA
jgi:hypothetical protein